MPFIGGVGVKRGNVRITKVETFKFRVDWCNRLFARSSTDKGLTAGARLR
jgi:hypothetical protein